MSSNHIYQYEEKILISQILQKVGRDLPLKCNCVRAAIAVFYVCLYSGADKVGEFPRKFFSEKGSPFANAVKLRGFK